MTAIDTTNSLHAYVHSVLRSIHALRFAIEWGQLTPAMKTRFRNEAFALYNPVFDPTDAEYKRAFDVFQHRHEKVVKARNDLKRMFVAVSVKCSVRPDLTTTNPVSCCGVDGPDLDADSIVPVWNDRPQSDLFWDADPPSGADATDGAGDF
ncbi:hypothetical protein GALMADRAFT_617279 [Galerina marginata CBS 339.88]|uniref:Uncharacterized protein n=1 Tax=Galerina marginata (strain CBS 339.88) TaxID=685588 RepID=A0A067T0V1_GALM3|nr:hypothetical protein GALMADRAFT_617279 [Galerina marginata CBS 339.88]